LLTVEIGFPVSRVLDGRGEIISSEIPGGKIATCQHTGPYSEIKPAYEELMRCVAKEGYEAVGVAYEFYLNDPSLTSPQELVTQIIFPLKTGRSQ
jgi:effector-binding domain-containing protein